MGGFFKQLLERRVPHALLVYFGICWGLLEFSSFAEGRYALPPWITDGALLLAAVFAPSVLVVAWTHGRKGDDPWGKPEKITLALNTVAAVAVMGVFASGQSFAKTVKTVEVVDENGETTEVVVANPEYRKCVAIFPASGEVEDADKQLFSLLMMLDLAQSPFVGVLPGQSTFMEELKGADFPAGIGAPHALKLDLTERYGCEYLVDGNWAADGSLSLSLTQSTSPKAAQTTLAPHASRRALMQQAAIWVREELELPELNDKLHERIPLAEMLSEAPEVLTLIAKAQLAAATSDLEAASKFATEAETLDPTSFFAATTAFGLHTASGRPTEGRVSLARAMKHAYRMPRSVRANIVTLHYAMEGDTQRAIRSAEAQTKVDPSDVVAWQNLGNVYASELRFDDARRAFERAHDLDPNDETTAQALAALAAAAQDEGTRVKLAEREAERRPDSVDARMDLGDAYIDARQWPEARAALEQALDLDPTRVRTRLAIARLDVKLGHHARAYEQGLELFEKATEPSELRRTSGFLASVARARGQPKLALKHRRANDQAAREVMQPAQWMPGRWLLLRELHAAGEHDEATQLYEQMLAAPLDPLERDFRQAMIIGYQARGTQDPALYRTAASRVGSHLKQTDAQALRPLPGMLEAEALAIEGHDQGALDAYIAAVPEDSPMYDRDEVAEFQFAAKKYTDAEANIREVLLDEPGDPAHHLLLAKILAAQDNDAAALETLARALELWRDAEPDFKPANEARALKAELESRVRVPAG